MENKMLLCRNTHTVTAVTVKINADQDTTFRQFKQKGHSKFTPPTKVSP